VLTELLAILKYDALSHYIPNFPQVFDKRTIHDLSSWSLTSKSTLKNPNNFIYIWI